jgi:hypothetical protein
MVPVFIKTVTLNNKGLSALDILYYEFLGNSEDYDIKWEDDPIERKNPSDLKTITIDVSSENLAQSDKPQILL